MNESLLPSHHRVACALVYKMKTRPEENIRGKLSGCKVCYYTHLRRMCIKFKVLSQVDTTHDQTAIKLATFTLKHSDIRLSA